MAKKMKAHKWTRKQAKSASVPNFGKVFVVKPALLKVLGKLGGKKVLELDCGDGSWSEILSKKGAKVLGIEANEEQLRIARAKKLGNVEFIRGDPAKLSCFLAHQEFDIILLEHVLLEVPTLKKMRKIFSEAAKFLKKGGTLVLSELHPFAPVSKPDNIKTEKDFNYFSSGKVFKIISRRIDGKITTYYDYHWTLEDFTEAITSAGLKITRILEPRPSKRLAERFPQLNYRRSKPVHIMILAATK